VEEGDQEAPNVRLIIAGKEKTRNRIVCRIVRLVPQKEFGVRAGMAEGTWGLGGVRIQTRFTPFLKHIRQFRPY